MRSSALASDYDRRFWRRVGLLTAGSLLSGLLGLVAASRYSNFDEFDSPGLWPSAPHIVAIATLTLLLAHLAEVDLSRVRDAAAALVIAITPAAVMVTEPNHSRIAITVIALATPGVGTAIALRRSNTGALVVAAMMPISVVLGVVVGMFLTVPITVAGSWTAGIVIGTLGASLTAAIPAFLATTGSELRVAREERDPRANVARDHVAPSLE